MNRNERTAFMERLATQDLRNVNNTLANPVSESDALIQLWNQIPAIMTTDGNTTDEAQCDKFSWILKGYQAGTQTTNVPNRANRSPWREMLIPLRSIPFIATAAVVLVLAGFGAWQTHKIDQYQKEVSDLKEWWMQTSFEPRPSTERIEAVQFAGNEVSFQQLFDTLCSDPSPNVRLSALQSLRPYAKERWIRRELEKSLSFQSSSVVILDIAETFLTASSEEEYDAFMCALEKTNLEAKWIRRIKSFNHQQI